MIKAIFFDAGFTLIDVFEKRKSDLFEYLSKTLLNENLGDLNWIEGARLAEIHFQEAHKNLDYYSSSEFWIDNYAIGLQGAGISEEKSYRLATLMYEKDNILKKAYSLDPQCLETLSGLKNMGLRLAIISNWDGTLKEVTKRLEIANLFEYIMDSTVEGVKKPEPKIFEIALDRMQLQPEEVVHVGDLYYSDVVGAKRAGIYPILYDQLGVLKDVYNCEQITELKELLSIVQKLLR